MEHKDKVKMARKMLSKDEVKKKTPIFQSSAWDNRNKQRKIKTGRKKIINQ